MVTLSARWPFGRTADPSAQRPDRLLRDNPVLLLSALQAPGTVAGLVAEWNPAWTDASEPPLTTPTALREGICDGVRWHGPFRLTPMFRADAGLPTTGPAALLGLAYVAEVRRERAKIGDSRHADRFRSRYPHGVPTGAEADAWHLVRGLAKRLRGVARLPEGPVHAPHHDPPLPGDTDHTVYSHEMLPWMVLREILGRVAPGLAREVVPDSGGYILRHRDLIEIRIRPAVTTRLPHALRDRADGAWPRTVYEFCDLSAPTAGAPPGSTPAAAAVRAAATLVAEVTGGVLVDADGFPVETRTFTAS